MTPTSNSKTRSETAARSRFVKAGEQRLSYFLGEKTVTSKSIRRGLLFLQAPAFMRRVIITNYELLITNYSDSLTHSIGAHGVHPQLNVFQLQPTAPSGLSKKQQQYLVLLLGIQTLWHLLQFLARRILFHQLPLSAVLRRIAPGVSTVVQGRTTK